jgi:flagellar hook-associated protein 3 FlgL
MGRLLQQSGTDLLEASAATATMRSNIGFQQENLSNTQARQSAELTTFQMAYNDLTVSDPFETAVKIEAVQTQLETHFTLTGRLSRLSLVEYI